MEAELIAAEKEIDRLAEQIDDLKDNLRIETSQREDAEALAEKYREALDTINDLARGALK